MSKVVFLLFFFLSSILKGDESIEPREIYVTVDGKSYSCQGAPKADTFIIYCTCEGSSGGSFSRGVRMLRHALLKNGDVKSLGVIGEYSNLEYCRKLLRQEPLCR